MKHTYIFAFLLSTTPLLVGEEFSLKLDQQAIPTIPMPPKTVSAASTKGEEKLSDVTRFALALAGFTSSLEKDLRNLEAIQITGSEAAKTSGLGPASYSANIVVRYLALLRPIADTAPNQQAVQHIIKEAENALSNYEKLQTEKKVGRKK